MSMKRIKSSTWFYLLVAYVFASYAWWAFLLAQKNEEVFRFHVERNRLEYNITNSLPLDAEDYYNTDTYVNLASLYQRQRLMIVGEGSVFMLLMMFGAWSIQRYFKKEMALAQQQQNFQLSITHELKSPLASIKLSLETLLKRLQLDPPFTRLLTNSVQDVNRLENLVDNILLAAKVEGSTYQYQRQPVDLSDMVEVLTERYLADLPGWQIDVHVEPGITVLADHMPLSSVIINLLENAIKYAADGKLIQVELTKAGKLAKLTIADAGPGIAAEDRGKVFEKFYRIGNEETRKAKGTGLGLYIVKRVVERHDGSVKVAENSPKGAIFTILLPLAS